MCCQGCKSLESKIVSPSTLWKISDTCAQKVEEGTLKYVGAEFGLPFKDMMEKRIYDDFFSYYFACNFCGKIFKLYAETYHGSGGALGLINELPAKLSKNV